MKCCWDHVDAARAGHLCCLQQMHEAGQFLDLYSPERGRAGEARKAQAWDALLAACKADQAQVMAWLLSQGWPPEIDAAVVWHLRDIAQRPCAGDWERLNIRGMPYGPVWSLPDVMLYLYAMQNPTSACLEVLLRAGCRSEWLCPLAAKEGRPAYLELAVNAGCPCDARSVFVAAERGHLEVLQTVCLHVDLPDTEMMMQSVQQSANIAASKGHLSCLESLCQKYEDRLVFCFVAEAAASMGQLECLQFISRLPEVTFWRGLTGTEAWPLAAKAAAAAGFLPCLKYLLELDASLVDEHVLDYAAASGDLECLAFVHETGSRSGAYRSKWDFAVASRNPAVLAFVLDNVDQQVEWDAVMEAAISAGALKCMQLLYARGYTVGRGLPDTDLHPVVVALRHGDVPCLQLAAEKSKPPPAKERLDCARAATLGEAALRCVAALGGDLHYSTTAAAAGAGQLGALRFAHEWGAPWDVGTLNAAVCGGSLECLQYAHQHGCPYAVIGAGEEEAEAGVAHTVQVLRYVCEHMDPTWALEVVRATASAFAHVAMRRRWGAFDWELLLYLARRLGGDVPPPLTEMVAVRRERAAAFAGVFYKAAKAVESQQHWPGQPSRDLWEALAKVPSELRERIAYEAHLVVM
eukprot:jgi/Botrbrau1/20628/Bobra.113_1s0053.1